MTWSNRYDRKLDDIFEIQDEVAESVVHALRIEIDVELPTAVRHDPEAYALYLRARSSLQSDDPNTLDETKRMLERALQIEPEFIDAEVALHLYLRASSQGIQDGSAWDHRGTHQ